MGPDQQRGLTVRASWGSANSVGSRFWPTSGALAEPAGTYQACVRAQCGQSTEVVTSASKA
jgi:hypothetical protein